MEEEKELKLNQTPKEEVIAAIARTATASPPTIVLSTPAPTKKSHQQGQSQPSSIAAPTPPPEAFQSLPLSSGTIHPPSSANATPANLPFVEDGSVNPTSHSTTVMMENIQDAKNDEEDVERKEDEQIPIANLKGIDEFLMNDASFTTTTSVMTPKIDKGDDIRSTDNITIAPTRLLDNNDNDDEVMMDVGTRVKLENVSGTSTYEDVNHDDAVAAAPTPRVGNMDQIKSFSVEQNNQQLDENQKETMSPDMSHDKKVDKKSTNTTTKNRVKSVMVADDNDASVSSSTISNPAPRFLVPRSIGSIGGSTNSSRSGNELVNMDFSLRKGGLRGSSILSSSQEDSSKESSEMVYNDKTRMKHLGLLLDRHHQQINSKNRNKDGESYDKDIISSSSREDRSSLESSEGNIHGGMFTMKSSDISNLSTKTKPFKRPSASGGTSVSSSADGSQRRFGRRSSLSNVSTTSSKEQVRRNESLFENFDKTWQSFHPIGAVEENDEAQQLSNQAFVTEQLCFASMVLVLLRNKTSDSSTTSKTTSSVPLEIVKFFWKEVILAQKNENDTDCAFGGISISGDASELVDNISDVLLNKLRYISIVSEPEQNTQESDNISLRVKLNHDVYADYSKHILKKHISLHPQNQINRWNVEFVNALEKVILETDESGDVDEKSQVSQQIINYAALHLPRLILLPIQPIFSKSNDPAPTQSNENQDEFEKDRINYFVSLMKNAKFLLRRMKILGSNDKLRQKCQNNDDNEEEFKADNYVTNIKVDVLKATQTHIKDLDEIQKVISLLPKEISIKNEDGTTDTTVALLSMYKAWEKNCLTMIEMTPKDNQSLNGEKKSNDTSTDALESTKTTPIKAQVKNRNRMFMKETRLEPTIKASESVQTTLLKDFRLLKGEYSLHIDGLKASMERTPSATLDNRDMKRKNNLKGSQYKESSKRGKRATMKLKDVLKIDPILLYHYLSVGKSVQLLGKSIFDATLYSADSSSTISGQKSLFGAIPNAASINYTITSIDIFMKITRMMSFILSSDLTEVDEDDLIDVGYYYDKDSDNVDPSSRLKKLQKDMSEAKVLLEKLNILSAESWHAIGTYLLLGIGEGYDNSIEMSAIALLNHLDEDAVNEVDPSYSEKEKALSAASRLGEFDQNFKSSLQFKVLLCFQVALGVLLHNSSFDSKGEISLENGLSNVLVHERNLQGLIVYSIGVHYYEQVGDYERAKICLDSSLANRRLLLRLLQREEPEDLGSMSASSMGSRSMKRSYKRGYQGSSRRTNSRHTRKTKKEKPPQPESSNYIDNLLVLEPTRKKQIALIEKGLSTTLEFSALVSHCLLDNKTSLSLFQEALILRAQHSGKDSLEVASLQYNMGVVHDDLAEYESSLGRYGESLRVRYNLLQKLKKDFARSSSLHSTAVELADLEESVVLTLRCMANVYRVLKDSTNSIGCLMKAIELLKENLGRRTTQSSVGLYQSADGDLGFGKGMTGLFLTLPMPRVILEEMKSGLDNTIISMKIPDNAVNEAANELDQDDTIRKDIATMYTMMISLVRERSTHVNKVSGKSGYTSSGSYGSTSTPVRGYTSVAKNEKKKSLDATSDNDSIILDSSFNLGLLALHFKEHKNALSHFEEALRTLWTSFSGDSSGESSDSDLSYKSGSTRKSQKTYFEGQVEEGSLYHALALAHASLSDHERAIRCYVTALGYYRSRFGLENMTVAGALYDCAYSYWEVNDYSRAEDFWADCLRILLSCDGFGGNTDSPSTPFHDLNVGRALYNLAAAKLCKGEFTDPYVSTCLVDASNILEGLSARNTGQAFNVEIGNCYFYSGYLHYKKSLDMISAKKRTSLDVSQDGAGRVKIEDLKCKEGQLNHALSLVDDSLNSYLVKRDNTVGLDEVKVGQKLQHPMQGHISLLSAWIHDELGSVTEAEWNYKIAVRLLNKVYSPENVFSASAMHSLGNLYIKIANTKEALKCYEESVLCRTKILGSDHSAVADTLFKMAGIVGNESQYSKATAMYNHCLKIRMLTEGNDGENVATVLLNLGLLHDKFGYNRRSQESLSGALRVRRSRIQAIVHDYVTNAKNKSEDDVHETEEKILKTTREEEKELATVLHHLGNVLLKSGDDFEAMSAYNEALSLRRKLCGIDSGGFAKFIEQEDVENAIEQHRGVLRDMADTLHNIGGVYETKNMYQQALSCYNQALVIKRSISREKQVGFSLDDHIKSCNTLSSAITLIRIGTIHNELQNYDISLSYYKSALDIQKQHLGRDHASVAHTLVEMGLIIRRQINNPFGFEGEERSNLELGASKYFNEALRISKLCFGPNHISVAGVMYNMGSIHDHKGDYANAINCYQHSVKVYGREYAKTLCQSLFNMSSVHRNSQNDVVDKELGLFHPITFRGNISNNSPIMLSQRIAKSSSNFTEIDREAYMNASIALAQVATRSGMVGWLDRSSFQTFVLSILHFITTSGVDPVRGTVRKNVTTLTRHLAKATSHAIVTVNDVPQNNFLYLIQD